MIIIIDAYNLIKNIEGVSFVDQSIVDDWILKFSNYCIVKKNQIWLVFDAGPSWSMFQENRGLLRIIYSGQNRLADDVIKEMLEKHKEKDLLLVTSDRELCDFAEKLNVESIGSCDFYHIFHDLSDFAVSDSQIKVEKKNLENIIKTTSSHDSSDYLDTLMEQGSRSLMAKKESKRIEGPLQVRSGKKTSKTDMRLLKKIKKI